MHPTNIYYHCLLFMSSLLPTDTFNGLGPNLTVNNLTLNLKGNSEKYAGSKQKSSLTEKKKQMSSFVKVSLTDNTT